MIVADVMGKGIPAALLGAATKSHFLEALCHLMASSKDGKLPEPKEIVMLAHADMVQHLIDLESFVTLCYARLDLNRRSLELVDCGHTGIIHWHGRDRPAARFCTETTCLWDSAKERSTTRSPFLSSPETCWCFTRTGSPKRATPQESCLA